MSTLTTNYLAPTGREEAWRFTPLARVGGLLDPAVAVSSVSSVKIANPQNGAKLTVKSVADQPAISTSDDLATIRAREVVTEVSHIEIAANAQLEQPLLLARANLTGKPQASRTLITCGANSHATIIISNSGDAILSDEIEFDLAQGSTLTFVSLQEWSGKAIHLGRQHAVIAKDATFNSIVVTVGGSLVRLLPTVEYRGPGSSADLQGLYFATDGQHLEHRLHVDHNVPNAKSRLSALVTQARLVALMMSNFSIFHLVEFQQKSPDDLLSAVSSLKLSERLETKRLRIVLWIVLILSSQRLARNDESFFRIPS